MNKIQKTLLAVSLAALSATSMAEVVLYGKIRGGVEVSQKKVSGQKSEGTTTNIADLGSRIGFKGHEHLSGNTKAIWQLEQSVNIGGGNSTYEDANGVTQQKAAGFGTRNSFIGLEGDFGRVRAGYLSSPVGDNGGDIDDWLYDGKAQGLATYTRSTDATGRRVAVDYKTPDMGGFSALAYVSPSDNDTRNPSDDSSNTSIKKAASDKGVYGVGLYLDKGPISANVVGTYVKNGKNNFSTKSEGYQAVATGMYKGGSFDAGVSYQYAKNVEKARAESNEVAVLVGFKPTENLRLKATAAYGFENKAYGAAGKTVKNKQDTYYQGIVGAEYNLSKRTQAFAQVGYLEVGKNNKTKTTGGTVGVAHNF